MRRTFLFALLTSAACSAIGRAQDVIPAAHYRHGDGTCCATGNCGTCSACLRIADVKTTKTPVYSCKIKEICVPNCNLLGCLFGCKADCKKIEVRQLVKKYRTNEECVSRCVTPEEAAKRAAELQTKKVAEGPRALPPAAVAMPSAPRPFLESDGVAPPVTLGTIAPLTNVPVTDRPVALTPIANQILPAVNPARAD